MCPKETAPNFLLPLHSTLFFLRGILLFKRGLLKKSRLLQRLKLCRGLFLLVSSISLVQATISS